MPGFAWISRMKPLISSGKNEEIYIKGRVFMTSRRDFLKFSAAGAGLFLSGAAFGMGKPLPEKKPNLLFIFTDDQRWDMIGYTNPLVHTPNLDRLAEKGMKFEQAFITFPVCTPARATALTGRYGLANGVTDYAGTVHDTERSFADYLGEAGYLTALAGKWHIGGRKPSDFGFDEVYQLGNMASYWQPKVINNGKRGVYDGFSTDYCVESTLKVIDAAQESDKPFCVWLCTQAPHGRSEKHGGYWITDEVEALYEGDALDAMEVPENIYDDLSGKPEYLKTYRGRRLMMNKGPMTPERYRSIGLFGLVTQMDRSLGKLFDSLEERGLYENTYVIFMSDNGLFHGEHGFMSKALHYEESIRVPMFAVGPGIERGGNESPVTNADIAPTLLALAGVPVPGNMHGRSLKGLLLEGKELDREFVFFELPEEISILETKPAFSLRSNRWKYIQTFENGNNEPYTHEELYDLKSDPVEMHNLAAEVEYKALVDRMRKKVAALRQEYRT